MLILLAILIFIYHFAAGFYAMGGMELSGSVEFLYDVAFSCGVIWWVRSEVHKSAVTTMYCQGMLMRAGWLFLIPYHLLKTRGTRGFLPLLLLLGSFLAARILAVVAGVFLFPDRFDY